MTLLAKNGAVGVRGHSDRKMILEMVFRDRIQRGNQFAIGIDVFLAGGIGIRPQSVFRDDLVATPNVNRRCRTRGFLHAVSAAVVHVTPAARAIRCAEQ